MNREHPTDRMIDVHPQLRVAARVLCCALLLAVLGCRATTSRFQIIDHRADGTHDRYHETFPEGWYDTDGAGNLDLILRRSQPSENDPSQTITQMVYIRSIWRSIPGRTVAERTQINAAVSYVILNEGAGTTFEGAGSVFFEENRGREILRGELELATLRPMRRLDRGQPLFERAELAGEFVAARDRRRVIRLKNDIDRKFGPLPKLDLPSPPPY